MRPFFFFFCTIVFLGTTNGQENSPGVKSLKDTIEALNYQNLYYLYRADFAKADSLNKLSENYTARINDLDLVYENKKNKGLYFIFLSDYDSAFSLFLDVLNEAARQDQEKIYYRAKFYSALTKLFLSQPKPAMEEFKEVIVFHRSQPVIDSLNYGQVLCYMGLLYYTGGDLKSAESSLLTAANYLNSTSFTSKVALSECNNLLAALNRRKGDFEKSKDYYDVTYQLYRETDRLLNKPIFLSGYAQLYLDLSEKQKAFDYLDEAMSIARQINQPREIAFVYQIKAKCYEQLEEYKAAYENFKKYQIVRDSLLVAEKEIEIRDIEKESRRELEKIRLNTLEQQLEIQRRSNERQKAWIFLIVIVCLYLLGSLLVFYRLVRHKNTSQEVLEKKNRELENKNYQIKQTQEKLIKSEKMALLGRISAGIAHELNTPLGAIKGNLELIDDVQKREAKVFGQISSTISKEDFDLMMLLIVESIKSGKKYKYGENDNEIKKLWTSYLNKFQIKEKKDVVELMTDLKIDHKPERFLPLCKHKSNVAILELILYINNRYTSIKTALEALNRAQKILSSFKTYSFKRGWEDYKEFDLKNNIETIIDLHKNILKDVSLQFSVTGNTTMRGIPDELSQVWTNLITNAIYAMEYKGELIIEVSGNIENIKLTVEDSGGGIKADHEEIFEPFYTTKPEGEGSGLGLDISRQIIQKHNGTINWENTTKGAKFTIVLPKNERPAHNNS